MTRSKFSKVGVWALAVGMAMVVSPWGRETPSAMSPDSAPALPAPSGTIVNVSTVAQLQAAFSSLSSNRTIVIAPGTYNLTSTLYINGSFANLTVRGATNNRDDVVLVGKGMGVANDSVPFGIWSGGNVTGLTIANLTIRDIYQHPIILNPGTHGPRIYNVHLINAGQQFIKANPDGSGGGVDDGIVEYSVFEYSTTAKDDYTNAVDVHTGKNWIVRHNLFRRIRAPQGLLAGPAVLMWNSSSGSVIESNTFIDCQREISLGLIERTPNDHTGGIIRNNFIYRNAGAGGDVGIGVMDSPNTIVANNTIFLNGQYPNAIEYRFANTTGVSIVNNLGDRGAQARDGATGSAQNNVWTAAASWFVSPASGDLHLTSSATAAINKGVTTANAPLDWDNQSRPSGGAYDVGADEYAGTAPPSDTTAPAVSVTTPTAGASVSGATTVAASASDNVGVAGVQFTVDGVAVGAEDTTAPYSTSWTTTSVSNGAHTVRAVARDAAGNKSTSAAVSVIVNNSTADTTAPTVSLTAPAAGANVSGTVTVTASASDNVGIVGVRFTLDGANLGAEDAAAPYSMNWPTTSSSNGSHVLAAIARDAAGNTRTSASRTVTVSNKTTDTTAPTISITAPSAGSRLRGTVTLSASASDNVGVVGVQFKVDGIAVGTEDRAQPYQTSWSSNAVTNGTHSVTATARDAAGNTKTSAAVAVTVQSGRRLSIRGDANGDGTPDIWFRNTGGQLYTWFMSGTTMVGGAAPTPDFVDPIWRIATIDDFDGDGADDVMWQNSSTGELLVWLMAGVTKIGEMHPMTAALSWRVVGSDDINGDGQTDLIWQNDSTRQIYVWFMDSAGNMTNGAYLSPSQMPAPWRLTGTADLNKDGQADLIWQNPSTGELQVWYLNGVTATVAAISPARVDASWALTTIADFDQDGQSDFLFQNTTSGQLYVWFMQGAAMSHGTYLTPSQVALAWQVVGR